MRTRSALFGVVALLAGFGTATSVLAATGAGTISASVVSTSAPVAGRKAIGKFGSKPADSKAGKPWTGGSVSSFKFNPDVGDPLKPGLATGNYVIMYETASTPGGANDIKTFAQFSYDASTKSCTILAHPSVITGSGNCGGAGQPVCADPAVGKCTVTQYQIAGLPNVFAVPSGQGSGTRIRIATLPTPAGCPTGTLVLGGTELYPVSGPPSHTCEAGTVLGVVGIADGVVCASGEGACP